MSLVTILLAFIAFAAVFTFLLDMLNLLPNK